MSSSVEKKNIKMTSNLISIWEALPMPDDALITWHMKINKTWFFPINSFNLAAHTYINKRHIQIYMSEVTQSSPTLCAPWMVAYQAPLSIGFSRQEYWSGLPFPSPGDLPNPGIEPRSPTL